MALSSRWLESLQQQLLAEQGGEPFDPRLGMDPSAPGPQAPVASPGPVGATSGLAMQPTGSPSYLSQVGAGFAQGGVGGGLASFFTDPNADRSQSGSNAWDVFRGITKSIGRAIGSAYGNPNFALAAQAQDDNSALGRERLYAYQQQVQAQIENDLQQRQAEAEAKAKEAAIVKAVQDLDPTTPEGNAEAVARLSAMGAFDVASKVKALLREKKDGAPAGYRYTADGATLEAIPGGPADLGVVAARGAAGRRPAGGGGGGGGGGGVAAGAARGKPPSGYQWTDAGTLAPIPGGPADRPGAAEGSDGLQRSTRAQLEKENIQLERDIARLDESMQSFNPDLYTWSGRAGRALEGVASSAGVLSGEKQSDLQAKTGEIQRLQMVSAELINKLYGAALSEAEAKRAETFVVNPSDPPDVAAAKLRGLRAMYAQKLDANLAALRGGSMAPAAAPSAERDSAPQPQPLPQDRRTLRVGTMYRLNDGRIGVWNGTEFEVQ